MVEFYDRAQRIVPVLFLPAANRQYVVEAKAGVLLPEPQHRLQIIGRKSEVYDALCELHLPRRQLKEVSASFPETSQSLADSARSIIGARSEDKHVLIGTPDQGFAEYTARMAAALMAAALGSSCGEETCGLLGELFRKLEV
jgi:hypothetical protein